MLLAYNLRRWLVSKLFGLLNRLDRRRRAALRAERRAERLQRYRQANLPKLAVRRHLVESLEARTVMDGDPVAYGENFRIEHDSTLEVDAATGVLAADYDPSGLALSAAAVDAPQHGSLTFNSDGSFNYTPDSGFTGPDSFSYQDTDSDGNVSNVGWVDITVNTPPAAGDGTWYLSSDGSSVTGMLPMSDVDGDALTAGVVGNPQYGSLSINSDGSFTYTPYGTPQADSFTYQANDGMDSSDVATISLLPLTASLTADHTSVTEGETIHFNSSTNDTSGNVSYSWQIVDGSGNVVASDTTNSFSFTPGAFTSGSYQATLTVTDTASQAVATSDVDFTVGSDPLATQNGMSLTAEFNNPATLNLATALANRGLGTLSYGIIANPEHGSVSVDPSSGELTYTPAADFTGSDGFDFSVTDDETTVTGHYDIAVVPFAAEISSSDANPAGVESGTLVTFDSNVTAPSGANLQYAWSITDPDGNPLGPEMSGGANGSTLRFYPSGNTTYVVSLQATDATYGGTVVSNAVSIHSYATQDANLSVSVDSHEDVTQGDLVTLHASASNVPDGANLTYVWDVRDPAGNSVSPANDPTSGSFEFSADGVGTYTASVSAIDLAYGRTVFSDPISLNSNSPDNGGNPGDGGDPDANLAASIGGDPAVFQGGTISLTANVSGQPSDANLQFQWTVTDASGNVLSVDGTNGNSAFAFTAANAGDYLITLQVTDAAHGGSVVSNAFDVLSLAKPQINMPDDQLVQAGGSLSFDAPWNNAITVNDTTATNLIVEVMVTNGSLALGPNVDSSLSVDSESDGNAGWVITIQGDQSLINQALAGLVYTPAADLVGADQLSIIATDGLMIGGVTQNAAADIILNVSPTVLSASDLNIRTENDLIVSGDLFGTVSNPGNLPIVITQINGQPWSASAFATGAGSVTVTRQGLFTYTSAAFGVTGDSFSFTVTNSLGVSVTANVNITIMPPFPSSSWWDNTIVGDVNVEFEPGETGTKEGIGSITIGGNLEWSVVPGQNLQWQFTNGSSGSVGPAAFGALAGNLTLTGSSDDAGTTFFRTVEITDQFGRTADAKIAFAVILVPPPGNGGAINTTQDQSKQDQCSCGDHAGNNQTGNLSQYVPSTAGPGMVYNTAASPSPIVQADASLPTDTDSPPSQIEVQLTYGTDTDSPTTSTVYYDGSSFNPGDVIHLATQADATNMASGTHSWQMTVTYFYGSEQITRTITGTQQIVNQTGSPFGNQWTLAGLDRLVVESAGVTLITSSSHATQFIENSDGTFVTPLGYTATLEATGNGYALVAADGSQELFDPAGRMTATVDANGNATTYSYDDSGRLVSITDPVGRVTTLSYDDSAHTVTIADDANHVTLLQLDASGNLVSVSQLDPNGGSPTTTSFGYDATTGLMTSKTDPSGATTTFTYDAARRVATVTDGSGNTQSLSATDEAGLALASINGDPSSPAQLISPSQVVGSRTDAKGQTTYFTTDKYGDIASSTAPDGSQVQNTYDANGNLTHSQGPNDPGTTYTYDSHGNLLTKSVSGGGIETWTYADNNNPSEPTSYVDAVGNRTTYTYDGNGNVLTQTTGAGTSAAATTTYTYDSRGNVLTVTDPLGNTTTNTYDQHGNLASTVDALGNETDYTNDAAGKVLNTTVTLAGSSQSLSLGSNTYDTAGNLTAVTDALGNTTANVYDSAGNLIRSTDPLGNITRYAYDAAGDLLAETDGIVSIDGVDDYSNASTTLSTYDGNGRLLSQITGIGGAPGSYNYSAASATTYTYDGDGNMTSAISGRRPQVDGSGNLSYDDGAASTTLYAYDSQGRQTSVTQVMGQVDSTDNGETNDLVTRTEYDAAGNVVATTDANGNTTTYQYDSLGRRTATIDPAGNLTQTVEYDAAGRVTRSTDANGNTTSYTYDAQGRVSTMTVASSDGNDSAETQYFYDAAGNLTRQIDPIGQITLYGYDALGRKTSVTQVVGQIDSADNGEHDDLTSTTTYDYAGRVLSQTDAVGNTTLYSYDAKGNILSQTAGVTGTAGNYNYSNASTTTYTYDADGHPTAITAGRRPQVDSSGAVSYDDSAASTTQYTYDSQGRQTSVVQLAGLSSPAASTFAPGTDEADQSVDPADASFTAGANEQGSGITAADVSQQGALPFVDGELCTVDFGNGNTFQYYFVASGDGDGIGSGQFKFDNNNPGGNDDNYIDIAYSDANGNDLTNFYTPSLSGSLVITGSEGGSIVVGTISDNGDYTNRRSLHWSFGSNNNTGTLTITPHATATNGSYTITGTDSWGPNDTPSLAGWTLTNGSTYNAGPLVFTANSTEAAENNYAASFNDSGLYNATAAATYASFTITPHHTADGGTYSLGDPNNGGWSGSANDAPSQFTDQNGIVWNLTSGSTYNAGPLTYTAATAGSSVNSAPAFVDSGLYYVTAAATNATFTVTPAATATGGTWTIGNWTGSADDMPTSFVDANGITWNLTAGSTYNAGALTFTASTAGNVAAPAFDDSGLSNNLVTSATYDAAGHIATQTDAAGNTTSYTYNAAGQLVSQTYTPGGTGGLSTSGGESLVTNYTYDQAGRLISTTAPSPSTGAGGATGAFVTTTYSYDNVGNVLSKIEYVSDSAGNPLDSTSAQFLPPSSTSYTYDYAGRVLTVTTPSPLAGEGGGEGAAVTTYTYDAAGNRTSLTDPDGNTTTWTYNYLNQVATETTSSGTTYYSYDADGQLIQKIDKLGRVTAYAYNVLGEVTSEQWFAADGTTSTGGITSTYDNVGNLLSALEVDGDGNTVSNQSFTYDSLGNRLTVMTAATASTPATVLTYTYNAAGEKTSLATTVSGTADVANYYSYDALGRVTSITQTGQSGGNAVADKRIDFLYNALNQVTGLRRYSDVSGTQLVASTNFTFNGVGQMTNLAQLDTWGDALAAYGYTLDAFGRIASIDSLIDGTTNYVYDANGQLVGVSGAQSATYTYDANGNQPNADGAPVTNNQVTRTAVASFTFDAEGNRATQTYTNGNVSVYTYDNRNRLIEVATTNSSGQLISTVTSTYDAFDRMISNVSKSYTTSDGSVSENVANETDTGFLRDGIDILIDFKNTPVVNGTATGSTPTIAHRFLLGMGPNQVYAQENVSSLSTAGPTLWLLTDQLGSVKTVITSSGALVVRFEYNAYGKIIRSVDGDGNPIDPFSVTNIQWTSNWRDPVTGLQDNWHRWYDALTAAWLGEDWIPNDVDNPYRYVGNNPLLSTDPTGFEPFSPYAGGVMAPQTPTIQTGAGDRTSAPIMPTSTYTTDQESAARLLLCETVIGWVDNGYLLAAGLLSAFLDRKGKIPGTLISFDIDSYGPSVKEALYINERKYFNNLARSLPAGKTVHLDERINRFIGRFHSTSEFYNIPQRAYPDADYTVVNEGLFLAFAKYRSSHEGTFTVTCKEGGNVSWEYDGRFTITDDYEFPLDNWITWPRGLVERYRAANYLESKQGYAPFKVKTSWQDTLSGTALWVAYFPGPLL